MHKVSRRCVYLMRWNVLNKITSKSSLLFATVCTLICTGAQLSGSAHTGTPAGAISLPVWPTYSVSGPSRPHDQASMQTNSSNTPSSSDIATATTHSQQQQQQKSHGAQNAGLVESDTQLRLVPVPSKRSFHAPLHRFLAASIQEVKIF